MWRTEYVILTIILGITYAVSEVNNAGYKLEKKKISDWLTVEK